MEPKIPMTVTGYERLSAELTHLKNSERPLIIKAIAEAREHGDLSENAEYHSAREKQGFIESRIRDLENKVGRAEVIDPKTLSGKVIKFGATVSLRDEDTDERITYQIVGSDEADIKLGKLPVTAPLARALIGKTIGDDVEVNTPKGSRGYAVENVEYI